MANSVVSTKLHDGAENVAYAVTGILDTSDYTTTAFTDVSSLNPVPTMLRLDRVFFSIEDGLSVRLYWDATAPTLIMPMEGRSFFDFLWFSGWTNPKPAGFTGNLSIGTQGWATSDVLNFSIVCEFKKQFS